VSAALPASGAWRPGDPLGRRRFATVFTEQALRLEAGGVLRDIQVAYETWGELNADRSNALLVCHALTGDSHATGPAEPGHPTAGWWDGLVGPGKAIDTDRWFVVCPNVLGGCQGTTGPASLAGDGRPYGSRFPRITVRDQVEVEIALADALGIARWACVTGGSMGGMRVLEWALLAPERIASGIVLASGAAANAEQIATQSTQVRAIRLDPRFRGGDYYDASPGEGPHEGLGLARRIGHLTYRTEREVEERFGRWPQGDERPLTGGRFQMESYLDHHAAKLARRFDANSYVALTDAMTLHDIGRGRGGVGAALRRIETPLTVIGIDSDRLYPVHLQQRIADVAPGARPLELIASPYGHDGFLIETAALDPLFRRALAAVPCAPAPA
jgi:homoserine O-acetyltransferase/O-succinyltransferase